MPFIKINVLILVGILLAACEKSPPDFSSTPASLEVSSKAQSTYPYRESDNIPATAYLEHGEVYNPESVIPPQCYTKTDGVNNPCYACHQTHQNDAGRPNQMDDGGLQGDYQFSDLGTKNHWKNLFVDRRPLIKDISNEFMQQWVKHENYSALIGKLKQDQDWKGEIASIEHLPFPDKAFDSNGVAKDGSHWVALNYKPFPSTFWPTNGSSGDAMIKLPKAFREINGRYSQDVYFANLTLVEMAIKDMEIMSMPLISETEIGQDLNGDGVLSNSITAMPRLSHYVGDAADIALAHMLYPENTELLHTVRYIGVDDKGTIYNAPRFKELRYMKKHKLKSSAALIQEYYLEAKEKDSEKLPQHTYLGQRGIANDFGWTINGYIEDENGELRAQHRQELAFCAGCHKTIGTTIDQTFSFPRKVDGAKGWGYINLATQKDVPNLGENIGEFARYFERVNGGDEFRQNKEMLAKWFTPEGKVDHRKVKNAKNVYELITPSPKRAMDLNKAYYTIVKEQSYLFGRDTTLTQAKNVLQQIDDTQTPLQEANRYQWDMRLDWSSEPHNRSDAGSP